MPAQKPLDPRAALGEPVGEIDDQGELGELGRVDRRAAGELEPARRTADHDVELRHEHEHQQDDGDDVERHRREPEIAVVDPHHHRHRDQAEDRPLDLRTDRRERVGVLRQVALERRRRVDHQDADRGQGDDHDEDHVVRLVPLASDRAGRLLTGVRLAASGRRLDARRGVRGLAARRRRSRRGIGGLRFIGPDSRPVLRGEGGDRGLERPAAGRVVDEHVEAGRGRAEQDGGGTAPRRRAARPPRGRSRPRAGRPLEVGRALGAGQAGRTERRLEVRPALADEDRRVRALGHDRGQRGEVDALVPAAGDQHDRRRRTRAGRR